MKYFKFVHDKNIIATISYTWSVNALIMNKDRVVICSIPVEDILRSKSWIETNKDNKPLKKKSKHYFKFY